jgi:hypothetical protein
MHPDKSPANSTVSWPPDPWVPKYIVTDSRIVSADKADAIVEEARLNFNDWMGRPVALFAQRSYPNHAPNGAAVLHIVGGAQTINTADLKLWTDQGYAAASFDWQITGVTGRPPERTTRFPSGLVPQFLTTDRLAAAVLPVAAQAAAVCLDWLSKCPEVQDSRLGVTGISWGGYLSWILAAYDQRVRALVPVFGCGGLFTEGRPCPPHSPEVRLVWEKNWEPTALGARIKAAVCYLNGTNDFFGDPLVADQLLDTLTVPRVQSYLPNVDHSLDKAQSTLAKTWMRKYLLEEASLPSEMPEYMESWWSDAAGDSMFRCWLPGSPPNGRRTLVFDNKYYSNGIVVSSSIREVKQINGTHPDQEYTTLPTTIPFGLGWRWELGNTHHFDNDAKVTPPASADMPWRVVPARPQGKDDVAIILHLQQEFARRLKCSDHLHLNWSSAPRNGTVTVQLYENRRGNPEHTAVVNWTEGVIRLQLADFASLPPDFSWAAVGRIKIQSQQSRGPFSVGPLKRR